MRIHRVNLALSDGDFAAVRRVANLNRVPVGTWARGALVSAAVRALKDAQASGLLTEFEQLELFGKRQAKGDK